MLTVLLNELRDHAEWYIESLQAEADLRVAQAEFDKQAEITKLLLEGIQTAHVCFITIFNYCSAGRGKSERYRALAIQYLQPINLQERVYSCEVRL